MIGQDYFKNKNITIVGLGRSGFACARLLHSIGSRVSVTESNTNKQIQDYAQQLPGGIHIELGKHTREFIQDRDLIVTSPGVNDKSLPLVWAREFNIPIISEIEVAWSLCPAEVIAVTGTNGKTTTAYLIAKVLQAAGKKAYVLGNIGTPFSAYISQIKSQEVVSLEISSFQLETVRHFKPKISVILNFSPDHLDRYQDLSMYLSAKTRIFMNQDKSDYLVLNSNDPIVKDLANKAEAKVVYFDNKIHVNPNFAAVTAVASILGIDVQLCNQVFSSFSGMPHRLEKVAEIQNIEFINDSKATNANSTMFALSYIKKPIILIAGGKDKGIDYTLIKDLISNRLKALVLLGEARQKIRQAFEGSLKILEAGDLKQAVNIAFRESIPGDCVLLSPMCASFDMFNDYEHRGRVFKQAVYELEAGIEQK